MQFHFIVVNFHSLFYIVSFRFCNVVGFFLCVFLILQAEDKQVPEVSAYLNYRLFRTIFCKFFMWGMLLSYSDACVMSTVAQCTRSFGLFCMISHTLMLIKLKIISRMKYMKV
jgi:hypothetical protein